MKQILRRTAFLTSSLLLILAVGLAVQVTPASAGMLGPSPQGDIIHDNPNFRWIGFSTADWYQLEVTVNGQQVINLWRSAIDLGCEASTNCVFLNDQSLAIDFIGDHIGSWRWRSYDAETDTVDAWSTPTTFTILAPEVFDIVWVDPDAPNYRVERITTESGFDAPNLYRMVVVPVGSNTAVLDLWTPPVTCNNDPTFGESCILFPYQQPRLPGGQYQFYVQGFSYGLGFSAWSQGFDFSIATPPPAPGPDFGATEVLQFPDQDSACQADSDGTGVLCFSNTLWPVVRYQIDKVDWIQIEISEEGGPVIFSQWVTADETSPYCGPSGTFLGIGVCTFAIPIVFEYGEAYTWRTRIYDDVTGVSPWTVPGGAGDGANVGQIEVVFPL